MGRQPGAGGCPALAGERLRERDPNDERPLQALGAAGPRAAVVLLPAGSGRVGDLCRRDPARRQAAALPAGDDPGGAGGAARPGAEGGDGVPDPPRLQDGDRQRQDGRDGDAGGVVALQPGGDPERRALPVGGAGRLPEPDGEGTAAGAAAGAPGELLPHVRPGAAGEDDGAAGGGGAGDELASVRVGERACRRGQDLQGREQGGGIAARLRAAGARSAGGGPGEQSRVAAGAERRSAPRLAAGPGRGARGWRGEAEPGGRGAAARGDGLGRRARPDQRGAGDPPVRRPLGDAVLPGGERPHRRDALPLADQRLRAGRRDRKRDREDPAATGQRQHRAAGTGLLPALAPHRERAATGGGFHRRRAVEEAEAGGDLARGRGGAAAADGPVAAALRRDGREASGERHHRAGDGDRLQRHRPGAGGLRADQWRSRDRSGGARSGRRGGGWR